MSRILLFLAFALLVCGVCPTAQQLQTLTGTVIARENVSFSSATLDWNQAYFAQQDACVIVFAQSKDDVVNALKWVQKMNTIRPTPFRIRAGRHSYEGYSVPQDGLVIDLSNLNQKSYDPETQIATFGAGLRLFHVTDYLMNFGRLFPGGTCPSVGLSGYVLGGGYGWFSRHYGLVDAVLEFEIVLSNGTVVVASSTQHTDLYWACRGAGHGNFGVITQFKLKTYPIPEKFSMFRMTFPRDNSVSVFDAWQDQAPREATSLTASLYIYADGKIDIMGLYFDDEEKLFQLDFVKLLLAFNPNVTMHKDMTFRDVVLNLAGMFLPVCFQPFF
jgi:FAD/FMN-containing dehydrogenase